MNRLLTTTLALACLVSLPPAHADTIYTGGDLLTPAGGWIVGFGYQPRQMKENRTPTIEELDGVASAYNPKADGTLEKLRAARTDLDRRYVNQVRLGGIKFWLDGSLDTAWFTQPYATNPSGKTGSYSGFRQIADEVVDAAFDRFWPTEMQIHLHMNADSAADLVILGKNPLEVDLLTIKDIAVIKTIKEGKTVFRADQ